MRERTTRRIFPITPGADEATLRWLMRESFEKVCNSDALMVIDYTETKLSPKDALRELIAEGNDPQTLQANLGGAIDEFDWWLFECHSRTDDNFMDWLTAECLWRNDQIREWLHAETIWKNTHNDA